MPQQKSFIYKEIIKRNGKTVEFNAQKIIHAIAAAGKVTGELDKNLAAKLTIRVINLAHQTLGDKVPDVEEIQDIVEEVLIHSPYFKTAKAYIIYRDQHTKIREITEKANVSLIDQYIERADWKVNENSNMSFSLQGLNNYISSEISKVYWLNKIYPSEIKEAHNNGDFHIHDLSSLSVYCVGWDLYDLLLKGFGGVSGKVESKPPKHFRTALGQITNFFFTLQGEAAGAQAFSSFDTLLAPNRPPPLLRSSLLSNRNLQHIERASSGFISEFIKFEKYGIPYFPVISHNKSSAGLSQLKSLVIL